MKEITEIVYMKNTLENYYFAQMQQQKELREAMELQLILEQECKVSGMSYDSIGNGCSVSFPKNSYLEQLSKEIATHDVNAHRWQKRFRNLDRDNKINYRLNRIPRDQKKTILDVYRYGKSISYLAKKAGISKQAYHDRLNMAIRHMMEIM